MHHAPHSVPTSCLNRFTPEDFVFLETLVFREQDQADKLTSLLEDPASLLAVLEHEEVFRKVVEMPFPLAISPQMYFFVLVRRSLVDAGIDEIKIADYVAATLAAHATGPTMIGDKSNHPGLDFTYHVDFVEAMEGLSHYEKFFLQVQCGNQFLVLTGLFPKFLEHRATRRGAPRLHYYEELARSAYLTAGDHPLAHEFDLRGVYPQLAGCLHETRRALNRMTEDYLFLGT